MPPKKTKPAAAVEGLTFPAATPASRDPNPMMFYDACLAPLGYTRTITMEDRKAFAYGPPGQYILWLGQADDKHMKQKLPPTGNRYTGLHICLMAPSRKAVHEFHEAALENGGKDEGAPGLRPYVTNYYAAYAMDPDGWKLEICFMDAPTADEDEGIGKEEKKKDSTDATEETAEGLKDAEAEEEEHGSAPEEKEEKKTKKTKAAPKGRKPKAAIVEEADEDEPDIVPEKEAEKEEAPAGRSKRARAPPKPVVKSEDDDDEDEEPAGDDGDSDDAPKKRSKAAVSKGGKKPAASKAKGKK
ncbi:hypothetical protein SmJEL517_g00840 [Synchytrium microbalum]|uniref:VOC domain-containing protein n=1 Tax=Synchytrium microbalum TaxID=1806994 RepID=A0A507CGE6_9FUNG|nr:uncharacterized protein SmJEL517_g00840 [Synchytrium microbalum]TPX37044.1 hypothetical protein SmJEL517_g00840 [Synchytrium microbalum]